MENEEPSLRDYARFHQIAQDFSSTHPLEYLDESCLPLHDTTSLEPIHACTSSLPPTDKLDIRKDDVRFLSNLIKDLNRAVWFKLPLPALQPDTGKNNRFYLDMDLESTTSQETDNQVSSSDVTITMQASASSNCFPQIQENKLDCSHIPLVCLQWTRKSGMDPRLLQEHMKFIHQIHKNATVERMPDSSIDTLSMANQMATAEKSNSAEKDTINNSPIDCQKKQWNGPLNPALLRTAEQAELTRSPDGVLEGFMDADDILSIDGLSSDEDNATQAVNLNGNGDAIDTVSNESVGNVSSSHQIPGARGLRNIARAVFEQARLQSQVSHQSESESVAPLPPSGVEMRLTTQLEDLEIIEDTIESFLGGEQSAGGQTVTASEVISENLDIPINTTELSLASEQQTLTASAEELHVPRDTESTLAGRQLLADETMTSPTEDLGTPAVPLGKRTAVRTDRVSCTDSSKEFLEPAPVVPRKRGAEEDLEVLDVIPYPCIEPSRSLGSLDSYLETRGQTGNHEVVCQENTNLEGEETAAAAADDDEPSGGDEEEEEDTQSPTDATVSVVVEPVLPRIITEADSIDRRLTLFVSWELWTSRKPLIHHLFDMENGPAIAWRDYSEDNLRPPPTQGPNAAHGVAAAQVHPLTDEADMIIAPKVGVIFTTKEQVAQRYAPGQKPTFDGVEMAHKMKRLIDSPLRERIFKLNKRYKTLYILISTPLPPPDTTTTAASSSSIITAANQTPGGRRRPARRRTPTTASSPATTLGAFEIFCKTTTETTECTLQKVSITEDVETVAAWILTRAAQHVSPLPTIEAIRRTSGKAIRNLMRWQLGDNRRDDRAPHRRANAQATTTTTSSSSAAPADKTRFTSLDVVYDMAESVNERYIRMWGINPFEAQTFMSVIRQDCIEHRNRAARAAEAGGK